MSGYKCVGEGRYGGHANVHMPIIYNTKRLDILEKGDFWFSGQPEVKASRTWGNNMLRMITWGKFAVKETGQQFYIYNAHFHHTGNA